MQDDRISIELRLPELMVLDVRETERVIEIVAQFRSATGDCPRCGRASGQIHQSHLQRKRDARLWGKEVWIALFKRRFRCQWCKRVFTEPDPVCGRGRRTTGRLRKTVARLSQEASVRAVSRLEGVSEGLVERSWMETYAAVAAPGRPHALLGLDGFSVRRPGRMWTGMWDLESGQAIAVMPGERQVDAVKMLERHADRKTVKAVAIDLSEAYRQAVELVLPDALVVADKFHVLALAGRSLYEVRGEARRRGSLAWLLQKGAEKLSRDERSVLIEALSQDPPLARAWGLKEALREVYKMRRPEQASAALDRWIHEATASGLPPLRRTAATLKKWRKEVLNYWRYPITNALVEGKHNRVKTLKRRGYGYRNDRSFMLRILSQNHSD